MHIKLENKELVFEVKGSFGRVYSLTRCELFFALRGREDGDAKKKKNGK